MSEVTGKYLSEGVVRQLAAAITDAAKQPYRAEVRLLIDHPLGRIEACARSVGNDLNVEIEFITNDMETSSLEGVIDLEKLQASLERLFLSVAHPPAPLAVEIEGDGKLSVPASSASESASQA